MEPSGNNPTATRTDLATIVADVLGDMAFLVSDDEPAEVPPGSVWLECTITYRGPMSGTLRCWCTRDFAHQLAANLLGLDPDDDEAVAGTTDALCEFMNVTCGQLVTALHGTEPVFDLSIPTVTECSEAPRFDENDHDVACELSVSGEPFYCVYEKGRA